MHFHLGSRSRVNNCPQGTRHVSRILRLYFKVLCNGELRTLNVRMQTSKSQRPVAWPHSFYRRASGISFGDGDQGEDKTRLYYIPYLSLPLIIAWWTPATLVKELLYWVTVLKQKTQERHPPPCQNSRLQSFCSFRYVNQSLASQSIHISTKWGTKKYRLIFISWSSFPANKWARHYRRGWEESWLLRRHDCGCIIIIAPRPGFYPYFIRNLFSLPPKDWRSSNGVDYQIILVESLYSSLAFLEPLSLYCPLDCLEHFGH